MKKYSYLSLISALLLLVSVWAPAGAEGFPLGDWAYNYAPEESVLLLREDGTAVFQGETCTWEDDGAFLSLTAENGDETVIRYAVDDEKIMIYLPAEYVRVEGMTGEGLIGGWIGKESTGSTYIFREDGMFLEDGTFTGDFRIDPEAGTVLLHYIRYFDDTLCFFRLEGNDALTVDYPWPLVEKQETP